MLLTRTHYLVCLFVSFSVCPYLWASRCVSRTEPFPTPSVHQTHSFAVSPLSLVPALLSAHIVTAMETLLRGQHPLFLSCRLHCQHVCWLSSLKTFPSCSPELADSPLCAFLLCLLLGILAPPCLIHSCGPGAPYLSGLFLSCAIRLLSSWFLPLCLAPLLCISSFLRRGSQERYTFDI